MFFILIGQFKVTPKFFPEVHEDMKREFGRVNSVFPFYKTTGWRPFAKNYRMTVGIAEIVCGATLVLIPGPPKQLANIILLIIMLGAVYTHYALHDKFERMAPGLVFSLLLITRLIIYRQVTQREKSTSKKTEQIREKKKSESEEQDEDEEDEDDEEEEEGEEEADQTQESGQDDKSEVKQRKEQPQQKSPITAASNARDNKKKNK